MTDQSIILAANVTMMVADMQRAITFYTEILGFKLVQQYGNHWADIEGPGIHIGLHPTDRKVNVGDNLQIGLRVSDLGMAISDLREKGVTFNAETEDQVRLAPFNDPDGNILYLVQTQS